MTVAASAMRERLERGPRQQRVGLLLTVAGWLFLASICAVRYSGSGPQQQAPTCPPCIQQQCAAAVAVAVASETAAAAGAAEQRATQPQQHQQQAQHQQQQQQADQPELRPPADWRAVDALINAPSPLHGLQEKGGLPDHWGSLLDHMTNRDAERHGVPAVMSPAVFQWFAKAYT